MSSRVLLKKSDYPFHKEGPLLAVRSGRWVFWNLAGQELATGDEIEILVGETWIRGQLEHDGNAYLLRAIDGRLLQLHSGMAARLISEPASEAA